MSVTLLQVSRCPITNPQRRTTKVCASRQTDAVSTRPLRKLDKQGAASLLPRPPAPATQPGILNTDSVAPMLGVADAASVANAGADFRVGLRSVLEEYIEPTPCTVTGTLPKEVYGTLFRNGPGQFEVFGEPIKSWFDGDGKIMAVRLGPDGATFQSRFIDTDARKKERHYKKRLFGGVGSVPRGGLMGVMRGWLQKNVANTNIAFFGNKLLALYEGGRPYRLDPDTLETLGEDNPDGLFARADLASAHPKLHAPTGAMWNFKTLHGPTSTIRLYRTAPDGAVTQHVAFKLPHLTMVHDFCLTETQAVFVISPLVVTLQRFAMVALGQRPMSSLPKLDPKLSSYIVTVPLTGDKPTARVAPFDTPLMVVHNINAWDEGDDVVIDVCDFGKTEALDLAEAVLREEDLVRTTPVIRRLRLGADNRVHTGIVGDAQMEFPQVSPHVTHGRHTKIWGLHWPEDKDYYAVPAMADLDSGQVTLAPIGEGCYASECIAVSKEGATREEEVWLLTVVLDGRNKTSAMHVYDGEHLQDGPVATVSLPQQVPHTFHGMFAPAKSA